MKIGDRVVLLRPSAGIECSGAHGVIQKIDVAGFFVKFDEKIEGDNRWWVNKTDCELEKSKAEVEDTREYLKAVAGEQL